MNADERRSSERAAGWCRPSGATASAVCGICGSDSCCSLSEHGRAEWRFARSAGTGGVPRRPWCGPTGASGRLGGWLRRVGAGCRGRGCFSRNCATTLAPAGAGSSRRVRHGRGHDPAEGQAQVAADVDFAKLRNDPPAGLPVDRAGARPGEGRAQVAADVVFAKLRNDPPAGAGSSRRVRPGRGTTRGRTGTGRGGRGFCEIAQRPSRRAGPPWAAPGKDGHRSRRTWFLRNRATTLPPGQAPPAGFDPGGGTTRGRTGTGRGGRGFCEIAQRPSSAGAGSSRRVRPGRGHDPGKDGHRSRRTWFFCEIAQRPSRRGRLLAGFDRAGARPGKDGHRSRRTVFAKSRNNPPAGAGSSRRVRHGRVFAKCATTRVRRPGQVRESVPSGQVPRGCARCNSPAPAWWRLRAGWVFGAAHPHPGRFATRPCPSSRPKPARGRGEYGSR